MVKEYGGIDFILNMIKRNIKGQKGGEFGISALVFLVDCCTANNTVAIVMAGPIAVSYTHLHVASYLWRTEA